MTAVTKENKKHFTRIGQKLGNEKVRESTEKQVNKTNQKKGSTHANKNRRNQQYVLINQGIATIK